MNALPTSIEAYLRDASFSATEILILRRLLDEDALTIRELAAKTGKSTGVLDQAMKKLLRKDIAIKEWINATHRYSVTSLQAVADWMERDMSQKRDSLLRRHQNFETFISTIKVDKKRPDIQYYEGEEGIKQAYRALLALTSEMLQYVPVFCSIEDDPLRDFRVDYFRERRNKGVFSRVITHDTMLGRRYHSRDAFEYRQSLLVPEADMPFTFEKIIAGDTIACINHIEKRACLIRYPELASMERGFFERLWYNGMHPTSPVTDAENVPVKKTLIPASVRTLSALREFLLSRKSLVTFGVLALAAAGITFGFYRYTAAINLKRMQDKIVSIASTGVFQFDSKDIEALRVESDWKKPEWTKVERQLIEIRKNNTDILYAYIIRKTESDPTKMEFVADADSLNPYANIDNDPTNDLDMNGDGKIDGSPTGGDYLSWPGQSYPTAPVAAFEAYNGPTTNSQFYEDQWGKVISGYAPIKNASGKTIAIFAADIKASKLDDLNAQSFKPILFFLALFIVFIFIRLAAFNRSLFQELVGLMKVRNYVVAVVCCALLSGAITYGLYAHSYSLNIQRIQEKVLSIAATGVLQFDTRDLDQLHTKADIVKPEYAKVIAQLNQIRDQNDGVKYIYILRPTSQKNMFEFVADADSLNPDLKADYNGDGRINAADEDVSPGSPYDVSKIDTLKDGNYIYPSNNKKPYTDQWGTFLSGFAPIKDKDGKVVAILGVDKFAQDVLAITQSSFQFWYYFLAFFLLFLIVRFAAFNKILIKEVWRLLQLRKIIVSLGVIAMIAFIITYVLYIHTLNVMKEQIGTRLMSIASTAVGEFNADDLNSFRFAKDMKTDAYQRAFRMLNEIRDVNEDIQWAYIMRSTSDPFIYEFVADANANYNLPYWEDLNKDGVMQSDEINISPGVRYYIKSSNYNNGVAMRKPVYDNNFYTDQWGTVLSGSAPIYDNKGRAVALLSLDMDVSDIYKLTKDKFVPWLWFFGIFLLLLILRIFSLTMKR